MSKPPKIVATMTARDGTRLRAVEIRPGEYVVEALPPTGTYWVPAPCRAVNTEDLAERAMRQIARLLGAK